MSVRMDDPTQWEPPKDQKELSEQLHNGREMRGLDLTGRDFSGVQGGGGIFVETDLSGANLEDADLREASFVSCKFDAASLARANLHQATLMKCSLVGANLGRARLTFRNADEARQYWPILRRALEQQYAGSIRFRTAESVASAAESSPPAEMSIRRYEITAVDDGALDLALAYEVAGSAAGRHDRQAAVRLRNAGPDFEILDWQRR